MSGCVGGWAVRPSDIVSFNELDKGRRFCTFHFCRGNDGEIQEMRYCEVVNEG